MSVKESMGMEPQKIGDNLYKPSPFVIKTSAAVASKYEPHDYGSTYEGTKKILMIGVEQHELTTGNGKKFFTGNHPVETFVPIAHFDAVGFEIDIATANGESQKFEEWAFGDGDPAIDEMKQKLQPKIDAPMTFADALPKVAAGEYIAIFIPGGHGPLIHLTQSEGLKKILLEASALDLFIISLCHGPAALLSAGMGETEETFVFRGYKIAAFPDDMDKQIHHFGYLPGPVPMLFNERLEWLGMDVISRVMHGKTHVDRKMITGDGPPAANPLGLEATEAMLKAANSTADSKAQPVSEPA